MTMDDEGVTDVFGGVLLVGVTIAAVASLGAIVFAVEPPDDGGHAELEVRIVPGDDRVWGTGEEAVRVLHRGGEPLDTDLLRVVIQIGDQRTTLDGDGLATGETADRRLSLGEAWLFPTTIQSDDAVRAEVYYGDDAMSVLLAAGDVGGLSFCADDLLAPRLTALTASIEDLTILSVGPMDIAIQVQDDCAGVDTSVDPVLRWRLTGNTTGPWTDVAMTSTGPASWTGAISLSWVSLGGQDLEYRIAGLTDLAGNVDDTAPRTDHIDIV